MERIIRIELTFSAWEADVLPMNYMRIEWRGGMLTKFFHILSWEILLLFGQRTSHKSLPKQLVPEPHFLIFIYIYIIS